METLKTTGAVEAFEIKDKQAPVNIHVDEGGSATITVDITNCYNHYSYPEWLDRELLEKILEALRGKQMAV